MPSPTPSPERAAAPQPPASGTPGPRPSLRDEPLTDDRAPGDWRTRYPWAAWLQITVELGYLVVGLGMALSLLYRVAVSAHAVNGSGLWPRAFDGASRHTLALGAVAVGGARGGFAFALKWLY